VAPPHKQSRNDQRLRKCSGSSQIMESCADRAPRYPRQVLHNLHLLNQPLAEPLQLLQHALLVNDDLGLAFALHWCRRETEADFERTSTFNRRVPDSADSG
jgi:hypothetical protein